jgi:acetyl-CoA carboxylase carboxyl transferase subunit beta
MAPSLFQDVRRKNLIFVLNINDVTMAWWKRNKKGITTETSDKKETPDGLWYQCPACKKTLQQEELKDNLYVCPNCDYHQRIGSMQYFEILFDDNRFKRLFKEIEPTDFLNFVDEKSYAEKIKAAQKKTGMSDAMTVAEGKVNGSPLIIAAMDFAFIGGSMGSVVGEKISRAVDEAIKKKAGLLIISKSGGARMMESAFSLMQMVKSSAKLTQLAAAKLPYISLMTDPTTGGVTASYAMLGDINMAEPRALIGFAGPRVVKETIRKELPEGFQSAEQTLENGFLDMIVHRKDLKQRIGDLLMLFRN